MTYHDWQIDFLERRRSLQSRLEKEGYTVDEVIDYFDYENMQINEPDFCPLYALDRKCHKMSKLNCYLCACPHFKCSDKPLIIDGPRKVFSICSVGSRHASTFEVDNNAHCDCTNCHVPHKRNAVVKHYDYPSVEDSSSFLDHLRSFQLSDILGRFKLF